MTQSPLCPIFAGRTITEAKCGKRGGCLILSFPSGDSGSYGLSIYLSSCLGADNLIVYFALLNLQSSVDCILDTLFHRSHCRHDKPRDNGLQGINANMPRAITMQKIEGGKPGKVYYPCVFPSIFILKSPHLSIAA